MNDLTRYEKELASELKHLSLPDKDHEWNEMKKLLDNDNDIITPLPFNGLLSRRAIYAVLLLLIIAATWFFINKSGEQEVNRTAAKKETAINEHNKSKKEISENNDLKKAGTSESANVNAGNKRKEDIQINNNPVIKRGENIGANTENNIAVQQKNNKKTAINNNTGVEPPATQARTNNKKNPATQTSTGMEKVEGTFINKYGKGAIKSKLKTNIINPGLDKDKDNVASTKTGTATKPANKKRHIRDAFSLKITNGELAETDLMDVSISQQNKTKPSVTSEQVDNNTDPGQQKQPKQDKTTISDGQIDQGKELNQQKQIDLSATTDSAKDLLNIKSPTKNLSNDTDKITEPKKQTTKKKQAAYFVIGLSGQQAVKLDYHSEYSGSTYKNKFAIKDYIPSLYLRYHFKKKWFAQAEFKYAAPHYVKEFLYEKQVRLEPFNYTTTSYVLKKTYFHELSLSYHYFIVPHLSAGVGLKYNMFSSSTSQVDMKRKLYGIVTDSLINSTITSKPGTVSAKFYNTTSILFEVQYQWKRFSLGSRYEIGLQPYVRYTNPFMNTATDRKNNSLNIFLRYELLRVKK